MQVCQSIAMTEQEFASNGKKNRYALEIEASSKTQVTDIVAKTKQSREDEMPRTEGVCGDSRRDGLEFAERHKEQ